MHHLPGPIRIAVFVTTAIWLVTEIRQARRTRTGARRADAGSLPVIRVAGALGVIAAVVVAAVFKAGAIHPVAAAAVPGLVLMWLGIGLRVWCFRTLGRYFTFTVQTSADQPVVDAGPYRLVRHPSYAALILIVTGLGLVYGNWLSVIVLTSAVTSALVYRMRVEERALTAELGDAYADYARTHKRLVPYLW